MAIQINLDVMLARRKMSLTELSDRIGIYMANLSLQKTGKIKGVRLSTLEEICRELDCQPEDVLEYIVKFTLLNFLLSKSIFSWMLCLLVVKNILY